VIMMEELVYWLALQEKYWLIPPEKIAQALHELGSMEKFWNADNSYLLKLGLSERAIEKFSEYKNNIQMDYFGRQLEELHRRQIKLISYVDKEYPSSLKNIRWPPRLRAPRALFHKGSLLDFNDCVAIGGTRRCSDYGRKAAYDISGRLAENGYTVVSGLATGVDTEAHKGALEARRKTVAVLAWMDPVYPPENLDLSKQIADQGAVLSECYQRPKSSIKWRFVERNKIISGISKCVIVIETGEEGGTIQLAKIARSQGRKIFVLEPKEDNERAKRGYKLLLAKGAAPIKSYKDVLDFLKDENFQSSFKGKKANSFYQSPLTAF